MKDANKFTKRSAGTVEGLWLVTGMTLLALATNSQLIQADTKPETASSVTAKTTQVSDSTKPLDDATKTAAVDTDEQVSQSTSSQSQSNLQTNGSATSEQSSSESAGTSTADEQGADAAKSGSDKLTPETDTADSENESASKARPIAASSSSPTNPTTAPVTALSTTSDQEGTETPAPSLENKKRAMLRQSRSIQPVSEDVAVTATTTPTENDDVVTIDGKQVVNYAGYDAVRLVHEAALAADATSKDPKKYGVFGTSEWWIDDNNQTLHIGAGTLADTNAKFDEQGNAISWGNIGWHQIDNFKDRNFALKIEGEIKLGADATGIFAHLFLQDELGLSDLVDTSQTQNISYMFAVDSTKPVNWNFKYRDTSHVTNMSNMFVFVRGIETIDVSNFDTSNVQNMHGMFQNL